QLGGGADAHNPQRTELALLEPAPGVRELQPALHRLFGGTVQLGFSQEIAAGALQYLFALGAAFGSAFDTRHGVLLFFWRSMQDRNSAAGGKEKIRSLFTRSSTLWRGRPRPRLLLLRRKRRRTGERACPHTDKSLVRNHALDFGGVRRIHQHRVAQFPFPLLVLRGQDVAQVRMSALHLASRRLFEALGSALVSLHFRHKFLFLILNGDAEKRQDTSFLNSADS